MPTAKKKVPVKKTAAKRPVKRGPVEYRCEACLNMTPAAKIEMTYVTLADGDLSKQDICDDCRANVFRDVKRQLEWYAVACVPGKDSQAKRNLIQKKRTMMPEQIGRVVIPREPQTRVTKDRYDVLSDDTVIGQISSDDQEEAMWLAKKKYSDDHANVTVKLVQEGGKTLTQNKKAMPGYLLVQIESTPDAVSNVKNTPFILTVLPFKEKMTFEDIEDGELPPKPTPLQEEEVVAVAPKEKKVVKLLEYKIGDKVKVVHGSLKGSFGVVKMPLPDRKYAVELKILGVPTNFSLEYAQIAKV